MVYTNILTAFSFLSFFTNPPISSVYDSDSDSAGLPWPMPQRLILKQKIFILDPKTLKISTESTCPLITQAIKRCIRVIEKEKGNINWTNYQDQFRNLKIVIKNESDCNAYPYLEMDEKYRLEINETGNGILRASSVWGVLRGLETFTQLTFLDKYNDGYILKIHTALIEDWPRFQHRGILLDTARHYLPVNILKMNLDLMSFTKFNVFHWHMVDDQSFPYVSQQFPNLSKKGAFSKNHVYTGQDVAEIVEYARLGGIRVIPEFDTPGHTLSWGLGQPGLLTSCPDYPDLGVIDPSNPTNFHFLSHLFAELAHRFPDRYVHLGGDEVNLECWRSNKAIQKFMKIMNITSYRRLENYYIQKLIGLSTRIKFGISDGKVGHVVWQEVFDNGVRLGPNSVVHIWKGNYWLTQAWEVFKVTYAGVRALLSSCWYLNDIVYGGNWEHYYTCEPQTFLFTKKQRSLVIGGEACMWGEYMDSTNVIPTLWPGASAVAERLWSAPGVNDPKQARKRYEEHRCRLIRRGYPASPIGPGFCLTEWKD